jgi:hypothetical protein
MRVVTNEKMIEGRKRLSQLLFFFSIGTLVASFLFGNTLDDDPNLAFAFQCFVLPALLLMVMASVRLTNLWVRQPTPWTAIPEGLKGAGAENVLYNYLLPAPHVLVSPNGIFAITTRFQDRPQKVEGQKWRTRQNILTFLRQEQIGNPTREAQLRAAQTQAFLRELLGDESIEVQPLIVFLHPAAVVDVEGETPVPILFASPERKKDSLKDYFKTLKKNAYPSLSKEQIAELDNILLYRD